MVEYQILLFYKYVYIEDPQSVRDWLFALCTELGLKGRLIVAREGLNITLEGTKENTETFIVELEKDARFGGIHFKRSTGTGDAFPRLSVKVRPEIVSLHLGACDIDPNVTTGIHLKPEELHEWLNPPASGEKKEFYIVDMRNAYEHAVGKFAGSICPPMENFRDLPKLLKTIEHLKDKTVLTVCTGGVRCEKASGYLITQGFKHVYQLDGGIVSYMEKYPNEDFEGKLYVFDGRVAMGFYTDDPKHKIIGRCISCDAPSENIVDCRTGVCNGQFILCEKCEEAQITRYGKTKCPKGCSIEKQSFLNSLRQYFRGILEAMKNKILKRGFTLIELLVVIAVIGILAAIVLAALSSSRDRGRVGAVQKQLIDARSQAELYRSNNADSYTNLCDPTKTGGINKLVQAASDVFDANNPHTAIAATTSTNTVTSQTGTAASARKAICVVKNDGSAWIASVPTTSASTINAWWCVDSSGNSRPHTTALSNTVIGGGSGATWVCP